MNRQFFFLVLAAAAIWFLNRRATAAGRDRPGQPGSGQPAEEEAERTRRVREEVQRKIAERRSEAGRPPLSAPKPAARPPAPPRIPPPPPQPYRPAPEPAETQEEIAVLAGQRKLEEQMRALEAAEAARTRTGSLGTVGQAVGLAPGQRPGLQLSGAGGLTSRSPVAAAAGLGDIQELRRAIVWREILGKPIGLR